MEKETRKQAIKVLESGALVVLPFDTVYGVACGAFDKAAVEEMYAVCQRDADKPFVIVLADDDELSRFGISLDKKTKKIIDNVWPGEVSVVMDCEDEQLKHLHRGKNSIAFRRPRDKELINILKETGPLATTSANTQGQPVPETIEQAREYFEDKVTLYVNGGRREVVPSTIIKISKGGSVELLRKGVIDIDISSLNK